MDEYARQNGFNRRWFIKSGVAAGAALALPHAALAGEGQKRQDDINVAFIGVGEQGKTLLDNCVRIPGLRIKAVCDIWPYRRTWGSRRASAYKHENNAYEDYREMLAKEKNLDAAVIATPDFWHSRQTVDCLKGGLHVYCEKEMSNTIEDAKKMVLAARETGKLLQIGHQRRSNRRYRYCFDNVIKGAKLLGRISAANGQWNRSPADFLGVPKKYTPSAEMLAKYGYKSVEQFRNWRWFKGLGGGPIVDLGSHQIDVFNWFLQARPKSVTASGRMNFYDEKKRQWYDTVMAIYEYEMPQGGVTAFYQTLSASASGGYFENLMGNQGSLTISESGGKCAVYRDKTQAPEWDKWVKMKLLYKQCDCEIECIEEAIEKCKSKCGCPQITEKETGSVLDTRETPPPPKYELPIAMKQKAHRGHLENFFDAIRGKEKLNCPAEIGYETAVTVLKVNEAIVAGRKLEFKEDEFKV
jgi:predicted dehydrogenase